MDPLLEQEVVLVVGLVGSYISYGKGERPISLWGMGEIGTCSTERV